MRDKTIHNSSFPQYFLHPCRRPPLAREWRQVAVAPPPLIRTDVAVSLLLGLLARAPARGGAGRVGVAVGRLEHAGGGHQVLDVLPEDLQDC